MGGRLCGYPQYKETPLQCLKIRSIGEVILNLPPPD